MKQYLLSVYQPAADPPPPEVLEKIMADVDAVDQEIRAAGAWVFAGGLQRSVVGAAWQGGSRVVDRRRSACCTSRGWRSRMARSSPCAESIWMSRLERSSRCLARTARERPRWCRSSQACERLMLALLRSTDSMR